MSRWDLYQVLILMWYCTHKYVTTLRHPGEGPPIQTEKLNIQNLEIKIQIGQHFHSGDHWPPGPRRRVISFCCGLSAGCSSSHIKPFMENVGQRSCLGHTNWPEFVLWHLFYFFFFAATQNIFCLNQGTFLTTVSLRRWRDRLSLSLLSLLSLLSPLSVCPNWQKLKSDNWYDCVRRYLQHNCFVKYVNLP